MALLVRCMLGKNTAQVGLARLGPAVRLLAGPPRQLLFAHGHAGAVGADIHDGRGLGLGQGFEGLPLLPGLGSGPAPLHQPLNLAGGHDDAAGFLQVLLGGGVAGLSPGPARQTGQRRSVSALQSERGVGRIIPLLFAFVVVIVAIDRKVTKGAVDRDSHPAFALLPRFGLVGGVDPVGGVLQQVSHHLVDRIEDSRAH